MASEKSKKFWEIGIPLSEAWKSFGPQSLLSQLDGMQSSVDVFTENFDPDNFKSAFKSLEMGNANSAKKRKLENEIKEYILTDIFNKVLIATGYREHPSIGQIPVQIDANKFYEDNPDWEAETFTTHGVRYGQIRITDPNKSDMVTAKQKINSPNSVIDAAIDKLLFSENGFCSLPRKTAYQLVCDEIGKNYENGNGLSFQNVCKAIVRKCGSKRISD